MIRFVDLTGQIYDWDLPKKDQEHLIAYYDTISDKFFEYNGEQTFGSLGDMLKYICNVKCSITTTEIERLRNVTPKEFL